MNILVCIKQVPASSKVEVDPVTGVIKRDGASCKMNLYDLYALETAFRIREAAGGTIHVISMGPGQAADVIREAFAMGADGGTLVSDRRFGGADVLATSYTLAQGIRAAGDFDLILCGKQTTDGDTAQVGSEIAEWLGIPSVANVREIREVTDEDLTIAMDLPEEIEIARVQMPCLLAVDKDIFMPRLPSYVRKKAAAGRKIQVLSLDDMEDKDPSHYGLNGSPTQVVRIFPPDVNDEKETWTEPGDIMAAHLTEKLAELKFI
ncbi:electron transfer flavoprotein subunit beta/FixA family protein [uncultured Faecalibaculum sp.]|uniref:electron transfer flavoprotein subunit beta/FixA family protein n=1 Tax=uncultured Faecalibaculum sp. TaxID=1729681 RepID=UPI00260FED67|nr:electron transfer flavoprotein subunit beta/FixA family protein [uncultured Faecalibaculum sp.]